jgi:predicted  nucleic acid-binding Zn-ribbon protein
LRKINKEIGDLKKKLTALQAQKSEIEAAIAEERTKANAAANRPGE